MSRVMGKRNLQAGLKVLYNMTAGFTVASQALVSNCVRGRLFETARPPSNVRGHLEHCTYTETP